MTLPQALAQALQCPLLGGVRPAPLGRFNQARQLSQRRQARQADAATPPEAGSHDPNDSLKHVSGRRTVVKPSRLPARKW